MGREAQSHSRGRKHTRGKAQPSSWRRPELGAHGARLDNAAERTTQGVVWRLVANAPAAGFEAQPRGRKTMGKAPVTHHGTTGSIDEQTKVNRANEAQARRP